jgi:outer membrane protein OmpA-like peptidoglycan-associated protein
MAELRVQHKKKSPFIWILLALIALVLVFLLVRRNSDTQTSAITDSTTKDTVATTVADWSQVDFNAPGISYEEVTDQGVVIRHNPHYTIYAIGENILFAKDQSTIQQAAEAQLKQITASLKKRFDGASLAVYGNADASGTAAHNQKLGAERAKAVRTWLIAHGVDEDKIVVQSKGETDPVASNSTTKGQALNRSVEIVAMADEKK